MEITLSQYAGFCEGVERAYAIVEKTAKDPEIKRPVFVLGSLVHNDDVVKKIEEMGIKKLSVDSNLMDFLASSKSEIGTLIMESDLRYMNLPRRIKLTLLIRLVLKLSRSSAWPEIFQKKNISWLLSVKKTTKK